MATSLGMLFAGCSPSSEFISLEDIEGTPISATYEQYQAIQCGQTIEEVEQILGREGQVESTITMPGISGGEEVTTSYLFGDYIGSTITVGVTDGAVTSKTGMNLGDSGMFTEVCEVEIP